MNDQDYKKLFLKATTELIEALNAENIRFSAKLASEIDTATEAPDDVAVDVAVVVNKRAVVFDRYGFCSIGDGELDQSDVSGAVAYLKG